MKGSLRVLMGIILGAGAAAVVALTPAASVGQTAGTPPPGHLLAIAQYCTDTGDYNNTGALDGLVRKAGAQGWELIGVYRAAPMGATKVDYVCFKRPR
jgi:hypothetical protein